MTKLTTDLVKRASQYRVWDLANATLYDLCARHPGHTDDDAILAKVWLIGRSYAAAIERRRKYLTLRGDRFYEERVAPEFRNSQIDDWFKALRDDTDNDIDLSLETHGRTVDLLKKISGLEKTSLASKYLHFHFPNRFFIFDSRARGAARDLAPTIGSRLSHTAKKVNKEYAAFFLRCRALSQEAQALTERELTPRDLDKILLLWDRNQRPLSRD